MGAAPAAGFLIGVAIVSWFLNSAFWTTYRLSGDDFVYLAGSRDLSALLNSAFEPHNAHVAPLFRLWVYVLYMIAGGLAATSAVFAGAAFLTQVLTALAAGHFLANETGSRAIGLAAAAVVMLTSALTPAVTWFCASQTLWAGATVIAMLECLRLWRTTEAQGYLAMGFVSALLAPFFWAGGYAAGVVGAAYLWCDDRPLSRKRAFVPLIATITAALIGYASFLMAPPVEGTVPDGLPKGIAPLTGIAYACQAFVESLLLGNLGLDAVTTPGQGLVIAAGFIGVWGISAIKRKKPSPLEAAGLTLGALALLLTYVFRSRERFEILRALGWYAALPEIGLILFAAGWYASSRRAKRPLSRRDMIVLVGLAGALTVLSRPRVERMLIDDVPPLSASERAFFSTPSAVARRALALADERARRQREYLERADEGAKIARKLKVSRTRLRGIIGFSQAPGFPPQLPDFDVLSLWSLPDVGQIVSPERAREAFRGLDLRKPPPFRPSWIKPHEPWPPDDAIVVRPD